MSLLTRLTREIAIRLLPDRRCVFRYKSGTYPGGECPVYLTFDDGPHPVRTPKILDRLAEFQAKATFFVTGESADRHPDLVRRIIKEGHSVGTHSWRHCGVREVSTRRWMNDVVHARRRVEEIAGCAVDLFRPPYGEMTPMTLALLIREGLVIVNWSDDPRDFEMSGPQQLLSWFAVNQPQAGSIVLLHDVCEVTASTLGEALRQWKKRAVFVNIPMSKRR